MSQERYRLRNQIGGGSSSSTQYALKFTPNVSPTLGGHNVNHGYMFDRAGTGGSFFWEAWVMPLNGAEYWISDGHGGAHYILCGFDGTASGSLGVSGNIWNKAGAATVSFTSLDKVPPSTLHHVGVGWDGTNINVYVDGVLSGQTAYNGNRGNTGGQEDGILYIGGSDHSNYKGWIFRVRGFEGAVPFVGGMPAGYFNPERRFRGVLGNVDAFVKASFLADYTQPHHIVPDLSAGYNGSTHPGVLSVGNDYANLNDGLRAGEDLLPVYELKAFEQTDYAGTAPTTTPANAVLFDEFRRQDVLPCWSSTGGSTAPTGQEWSTNMGVLSEKAFLWANAGSNIWIDPEIADIDVTFTNGNTAKKMSYNFRRNGGDYLSIQTGVNMGLYDIYLVNYTANNPVIEATATQAIANETFTTLRIVANGTNVKVYVDGTLEMDATTSRTTGTEVGVGMNPLCRLDKIEVYAV